MEKSHYQAKAVYFKGTRHGGGKRKSNAFHEMFNWFYRSITGKEEQKSHDNLSLRGHIMKIIHAKRIEG